MNEKQLDSTTSHISISSGIKSRVLSILHTFVSAIYYERNLTAYPKLFLKNIKATWTV